MFHKHIVLLQVQICKGFATYRKGDICGIIVFLYCLSL